MPATCFACGGQGHIAAECDNLDEIDKRPTWCGICDRRTRLVTIDLEHGTTRRCHDCHPSPCKPLTQHRRCGACRMTVYAWDTSPCGKHESPAAPDRRLPIDAIREIERSNS
jgi:hypothetical protein